MRTKTKPENDLLALEKDYVDMARCLIDAGVDFLLVGGYAVLVHGYPRTTFDIDFWVRPDSENAKRVIQALRSFGAPMSEISERDFDHPDIVFQIGVAPCRIDMLTKIDGVTWEEAKPGSKTIQLDNLTIPVIGLDELIQNKKASGRPKDSADAAALERIRKESGHG
jgi:hypothetical protein